MSDVGERGASLQPGWIKLLLLAVAALIAAWFSLRHALLDLLERDYPLMGLEIAPSSPVSAGIVAVNRVGRDGVADSRTRWFLELSARRAPLLPEPFIAAGLDESARDRPERAMRLFEHARERDPRSVVARYWLFDHYLRTGQFAKGIDEAQPLLRLQPAVTSAVTSLLTALLDVPEARGILLDRLKGNPPWRREFLRQVAGTPRLRSEHGTLLLSNAGKTTLPVADQQRVIAGLLRGGDADGAWKIWVASLPAEVRKRAQRGAVYDGDFAGWPGAAPFNWRIAQGGVQLATSSPGDGSALQISLIPTKEVTLAEQSVLTNAGGRLRLSFNAQELDEQPSAGLLEAQIRCNGRGPAIATRRVDELARTVITYTLESDLPKGCRMVQVRFVGRPGEEAGGLSASLSAVRLIRMD